MDEKQISNRIYEEFKGFINKHGKLLAVLFEEVYKKSVIEDPEAWQEYCLDKFFKFNRR